MKISEILEIYKPIHFDDQIMVQNNEDEILHLPVRVKDFDENFPDMEIDSMYINRCGFVNDNLSPTKLSPTLVLVVKESTIHD